MLIENKWEKVNETSMDLAGFSSLTPVFHEGIHSMIILSGDKIGKGCCFIDQNTLIAHCNIFINTYKHLGYFSKYLRII